MKLKLPPPFEDLLRRHEGELLRFLYRLTGDREDALDLFQDTCLRAYRAYPEVNAEGNLRAWLFRIAANVHLNQVRSRARRGKAASALQAEARRGHAVAAAAQDGAGPALAYVRRALERLPHKQREALVMRKFGGLDYGEIAAQLGCSNESARANVAAALKKLKDEWLS
jgi:RNA polymerase sigma-70 factor (ECF subfamily)